MEHENESDWVVVVVGVEEGNCDRGKGEEDDEGIRGRGEGTLAGSRGKEEEGNKEGILGKLLGEGDNEKEDTLGIHVHSYIVRHVEGVDVHGDDDEQKEVEEEEVLRKWW